MANDDRLTAYAKKLLEARRCRHTIARPGGGTEGFDTEAGYQVGARVDAALRSLGWRPVGRKLGFTNKSTWKEFGLATPIWAHVYDRTVIEAGGRTTEVPVSDLVAPRIEPEIVLGLNAGITRATSDPASLAAAIEWVAPGFEIVDCHFPGWEFDAAAIIADFGAHARLAIGERVVPRVGTRASIAAGLAATSVELRRGGEMIDAGRGSNALGGPVAALGFLVEVLAGQARAEPLAPGELVTTGTLTGLPHVFPGESWTALFSGAGLGDLTIRLI